MGIKVLSQIDSSIFTLALALVNGASPVLLKPRFKMTEVSSMRARWAPYEGLFQRLA